MTPPVAVPAPAATNLPVEDALPTNNDNTEGLPLNVTRNVPDVKIKFEDVENYMIEKAKKESLNLVKKLESKHMQALTQKISKMEEQMKGQGMSYSFNFDDILSMEGEKLPNKFKMPQI